MSDTDKGFRVAVRDLENGDKQVMEISPGDYLLVTADPCYLHYESRVLDGTVRMTLKDCRAQRLPRTIDPATVPHTARRGSDIEAFVKAYRDQFPRDMLDGRFHAIDDLLDLYRLHADTGVPLGEPVSEGNPDD
jgi:hypothetical protein